MSSIVGGRSIGGVSGSENAPIVKGNFNPGSHLTLGSAGVVVALQAKFGVGLGIDSVSSLYYISAIASVGETTGSAVAGQSCVSMDGDFSITGNFETQLSFFKTGSPAKTFYYKSAFYKQPSCQRTCAARGRAANMSWRRLAEQGGPGRLTEFRALGPSVTK